MNYKIDLADYRSANSHVFAGRMRGEAVRDQIDLLTLEKESESIEVEIPQDTLSFSPSFFLGMFSLSITRLGLEIFNDKYTFKCPEIHLEDIEEGKERSVKESSVFETD